MSCNVYVHQQKPPDKSIPTNVYVHHSPKTATNSTVNSKVPKITNNSNKTNHTTISSININGIKRNIKLLEVLSQKSDFILVQEHKLWAYEKSSFFKRISRQKEGNFLNNWSIHIKSYDDLDNIPPKSAPRGRAGTAILYSNKIAHLIKTEPDGSHRFTVITAQCNPSPICLISIYLPSTYSKSGKNHIELFNASLDELESIADKFKSLGYII